MDSGAYTVLLTFDASDRQLRQKVLQQLTRIDPTASQRLLNMPTGRIIVKKNLDLTTARRLASALQTTGAECTIRKQSNSHPPGPLPEAASRERKIRSRKLITCPNCQRQQPPAVECQICGVVFEKARHFRKTAPGNGEAIPRRPQLPVKNDWVGTLRRRIQPAFAALIRKRPIEPEIIADWRRRLVDRAISCAIVFTIALILEICMLYVSQLMWIIYCETDVGRYYVKHFAEKAGAIQRLMDMDPMLLGWDSTLMVLWASLLISIVGQFFHLIRHLFDSQGLLGKLILWCAPTAALAAWAMIWHYHLPDFWPAIGLVAVPTLCILTSCIQLARDTMPEMGVLWKLTAQAIGHLHLWTKIKDKLLTWINTDPQ